MQQRQQCHIAAHVVQPDHKPNAEPLTSMTTCPASVPVMVLFCPLAKSARANTMDAALLPSEGASSL